MLGVHQKNKKGKLFKLKNSEYQHLKIENWANIHNYQDEAAESVKSFY